MNSEEKMDKKIETVLNSLDSSNRAAPMPFLQTRINARLNKEVASAWEKIAGFVSRPSIAIAGLCFVLLVNVLVIGLSKSANTNAITDQATVTQTDEFSISVATIYDFENNQ